LKRLSKKWDVTGYFVNGVDSTKSYRKLDPIGTQMLFEGDLVFESPVFFPDRLHFNVKSPLFEYFMILKEKRSLLEITDWNGKWEASRKCDYRLCEKNIFMPYEREDGKFKWIIEKLTEKELIISMDDVYSYKIIMNAH
jgi:hypothetical protein